MIVGGATAIGNLHRAIFEDPDLTIREFFDLNAIFQEAIGAGLRCLDTDAFVSRGLETPIFDALGDIVQNCDYQDAGTRAVLVELASAVLTNLETQLNNLDASGKTGERADFLANNYCGLMQATIVRLEGGIAAVRGRLQEMLGRICAAPAIRVGAILMLGALQHVLDDETLLMMAPDLVRVADETLNDVNFDTQCKRNATGLIQDLAGSLGEKFAVHVDQVAPVLHRTLEANDLDPTVKTCAIMAVGDLCLTTEANF